MPTINVYRRRTFTLLMMVLFAAVTVVMIVGLVQSYFPKYSGLENLKITDTGRMISIIFTLFMAAITWRYFRGFIHRGKVPVIRIEADRVHFDLRVGESETLMFADVESLRPIDGNFETAVVTYRTAVPADDPRYPASVEVPLGLSMTRSQVLKIINARCAAWRGAVPSRPASACVHANTPLEGGREDAAPLLTHLPPRDKTVRIYWERWAPVIVEVLLVALGVLFFFLSRDERTADDYLWFVSMHTWCTIILAVLALGALVTFVYLCIALVSPKLVITPDAVRYRGVTVPLSDLTGVTVEHKRKRVAPTRYVTEHFIRFNYRPEAAQAAPIPGLDPDLLEMKPPRIAAIINSRLQ